ncbi:MAG: quinol:cytochrome C oxidoreductase [Candidatus Omnitrophica bacterium]|nr:quinol:cytochrome C oxidoreductase [Candidatus Omnitrophota bacterium]
MHLTHPSQIFEERTRLDRLGRIAARWSGIVGLASLGLTIVWSLYSAGGLDHFYHSYLTSFCYFLSLSLGALFFVMLQHLTRAAWSVAVRRIAEIVAASVPLFAILFIPILFGLTTLYHWTDGEAAAHDPLLQSKSPYLNSAFFLVRCVFYFACWWILSRYLFARSLQQDKSGDPSLTLKMEKVSAPGMILFALTLTFAAFDWLMSLDAHWYSTIYGVYYFAGSAVGFLALLTILCFLLQRSGRLTNVITIEHYHDLGKLLFAFIFFWAYIAFSQYLLIWYANIPEETAWYLKRQEGPWLWISLLLLFGHFIIPFLGLLSRYPKRRKTILAGWAAWMLIMHWIDLYWLVMPEFSRGRIPFHVIDLGCLLGIGGLFLATIAYIARGRSLAPLRDPRLGDSLTFENA